MLETRLLRHAQELVALAPDWSRLLESCSSATVFQSPEWLLPWWAVFCPGELMSVAVLREGRLLGLAPLYLERGPRGARLLPLGISVSDYVDVLIDPGLAEPVAEAIIGALLQEPSWDLIQWNELHGEAMALRMQSSASCRIADGPASPCPVLTLQDTASGNGIPLSKRRKLRMAHHRLARHGGAVSFIDADASSALPLFEELVRLHSVRWQSRAMPGVFGDPRLRAFHRRALPALVGKGMARLHGITIDGEIAAVYYGFADRDCAYAYLTGFDPRHALLSPGSVLLEYVIEQGRKAGMREINFLRGEEPYKYEWGAEVRRNRWRELHRIAALCHA
jgi:CelD/BcsL family acetyltransferase involved in cellulose biosynthesis